MSTVTLYDDATNAWGLIEGDALAVLAKLPENSVDAVVSDPPYGIGFKGQSWDGRDIERAAGDGVASPGEAFQRWTSLWAAQCRRVLKPGGHLVAFGAPRTVHRLVSGIEDTGLEIRDTLLWMYSQGLPKSRRLPGGMGTGLKPGYEPIVLARAPLDGGTTEANIQKWATGALNIDACRVGEARYWPANVVLSHAPDCPVRIIDTPGEGPSRLFFCSKASKVERERGCEQLPQRRSDLYTGKRSTPRIRANVHPTVKPISLMRWLVRMIAPADGIVLDPFSGSGTTGIAAMQEGRSFVGIEKDGQYVDISCARLTHHAREAAA